MRKRRRKESKMRRKGVKDEDRKEGKRERKGTRNVRRVES